MTDYKTQIRNHSPNTINLPAPKNYVHRTLFIQPNATVTISFRDEAYILSGYERITYKKSGKVETKQRAGFKRDLEFPVVCFLNDGNTETEVLRIADHDAQILPRGIEVVRHVPIHSHFADYESVTIAKQKECYVPEYNTGNLKRELRQNIQYRKRPQKDLDRLKKMRERSYLKSVGLG
jgi:hypothetical protein